MIATTITDWDRKQIFKMLDRIAHGENVNMGPTISALGLSPEQFSQIKAEWADQDITTTPLDGQGSEAYTVHSKEMGINCGVIFKGLGEEWLIRHKPNRFWIPPAYTSKECAIAACVQQAKERRIQANRTRDLITRHRQSVMG